MRAASAVRLRPALAALAAAILIAGCGGDDGDDAAGSSAPPEPVGKSVAGSVVQFADCGDWREGTEEERRATVVALRRQLTPTQSKTGEGPLDDSRAYEIFQTACKPAYAKRLRLYKLYVRAQGFAPLAE